MMQPVNPALPCPANANTEGKLQSTENVEVPFSNRHSGGAFSAATLGLAISVGATGMLLSAQSDAVLAANSTTPTSHLLEVATDAEGNASSDNSNAVALAVPQIKRSVEKGESQKGLSSDFRVEESTLLPENFSEGTVELSINQPTIIPNFNSQEKEAAKDSAELAKQAEVIELAQDDLQETRKRLNQSMAMLKSEANPASPQTIANTIEVADASIATSNPGPESIPQLTATSHESQRPESVEIPVPTLESLTKEALTNSSESSLPNLATNSEPSLPAGSSTLEQAASLPKRLEDFDGQSDDVVASKIEQELPSEIYNPRNSDSSPPQPLILSPSAATTFIPGVKTTPSPLPSETSLPASPLPEEKTYRVRKGDTLNSIARRHGITVSQLIRANNISNPNKIKVNQVLLVSESSKFNHQIKPLSPNSLASNQPQPPQLPQIPPASEVSISLSSGENTRDSLKSQVEELQQSYPSSSAPIAIKTPNGNDESGLSSPTVVNPDWSGEQPTADTAKTIPTIGNAQPQLLSSASVNPQGYNNNFSLPLGKTVAPELPPLSPADQYLPNAPLRFNGYIWPAKGVLTSGYGWRWGRMHKGIDIAGPVGTPIVAAAPGTVISAGWNSGGYGNLVKVRHPDGSTTLYAHNSRIMVRRGQSVKQGQLIAKMGSTGFSTGPHLHFELHAQNKGATNPIAYLPRKSR